MPVIVKEVGWGISPRTARLLADAGVAAIDVAGSGGTSWAEVEYHRTDDLLLRRLARTFVDWGIPTANTLMLVRETVPEMPLFASGGLRTGLDVAKCIALGANLVGLAAPFLKTAAISADAVLSEIDALKTELAVSMFLAGAEDIAALREPGRLVMEGSI